MIDILVYLFMRFSYMRVFLFIYLLSSCILLKENNFDFKYKNYIEWREIIVKHILFLLKKYLYNSYKLSRLLTYDYPDYYNEDDAHNYHHLKIY